MSADTTTLANALRPAVDNIPTIARFHNLSLPSKMREAAVIAGVGDIDKPGTGANAMWNIIRGNGNTSRQTFTEGTAAPGAGNQTDAQATLGWIWFRIMCGITGIAEDVARGASYYTDATYGEAGMYGETALGLRDLFDLVTTTFLGSATHGLLAAVDDGTTTVTYANNNRVALADLRSYVEPGGGVAVTYAGMNNVREALADTPRGQPANAWFVPENQRSAVSAIIGIGAAASLVRFTAGQATAGGALVDAGYGISSMAFDGVPIYSLPGMSTTNILALTMQHWEFRNIRELREDPQPLIGDQRKLSQWSTGLTMVCKSTRHQAKYTNLLA